MLQTIGVRSIDELFREIPEELHLEPGKLNLPEAHDEARLMGRLTALASQNLDASKLICFLGAGIYDRFVPSTVGAVISRGEFLTAYTPYQPEASQGYLQTIYEFQSMVAEIYGMDVANASMYDGATALAEAAILAMEAKDRKRIAVSKAIHPHYRAVLDSYCWSIGFEAVTLDLEDGLTAGINAVDNSYAGIIVQSPNFFGLIEDLAAVRSACDRIGGLMIVSADPVSCGILKPPGEYGADVVVGEGQPMGVAMGLGGPLVGLLACRQELVRKIPGRIVGRTREAHGEREGFVMTLRTREQDIRREKATSNICTNEALMALAVTVYMTTLGKNGLRQVAEGTVRNTQYTIESMNKLGLRKRFSGRVFGEFAIELPVSAVPVRDAMIEKGFLAGLPLGHYYPDMENCLLVAVTEIRTREQIDRFASSLAEVLA